MSDTKDLQYFKDEVAKMYGIAANPETPPYKYWDIMQLCLKAQNLQDWTLSRMHEASERYAAHLQEMAFDEGCEAQRKKIASYEMDPFAIMHTPNAHNPYKTQSNEPENT
jgi:hypothetical protein